MEEALGSVVIIAVGDELTSGLLEDTNSSWLAHRLYERGYRVSRIEVVGDGRATIASAVRRSIGDPNIELLFVCGGLGPTPDDRTQAAVADGLGREIETNPQALSQIDALMARMRSAGWRVTPSAAEANRAMARVGPGATVLPNRRGMAPSIAYRLPRPGATDGPDSRWLFVLPGVPRELMTIVDEEVLPRYCPPRGSPVIAEKEFPLAGEAELAQPIRSVEAEFPGVRLGSYPQWQQRTLIMRAYAEDESVAIRALEQLEREWKASVSQTGA